MSGYQLGEPIYESSRSTIYRGIRNEDKANVVMKILNSDTMAPNHLAQFRMEYAIASKIDMDGAVKAHSLEAFEDRVMIVFNDIQGHSLDLHLRERGGKFTVQDFLPVAISLAKIVDQVHTKNYIHKNINPGNIVWKPDTGQIQLIDFGITTEQSREEQTLRNPRVMEGTLAYMSPEQTGRMNRAMDYRTDLYSLGVTFYQMLAGTLPFESDDPMEMVYSHIARLPVPLHEQDPAIPEPVSAIIMKLLAKMAGDRYQSAANLASDLTRCLKELTSDNTIPWFEMDQESGNGHFHIPQKFYGRENEIDLLIDGFSRASKGGQELMLVAGYSGIGKSSLVKEIYQPVVRNRGYFLSGKFDQYQHDTPYAPFIQAFTSHIKYLLREGDTGLTKWRKLLQKALREEAQVLVDVIPDLELIIGRQPPVLELHGVEALTRFRKVFLRFLNSFCTAEHPLTIFLDDLQWVDPASLTLLKAIFSKQSQSRHLLVLGAYRDNEVSASHPLMLTLDEIMESKQPETRVSTITIGPLSLIDTQHLVSDTIQSDVEQAVPLAALVQQKTAGNPFFIKQLLTNIFEQGMLDYSVSQRRWVWDEDIESFEMCDNVADLLSKKIGTLPEITQTLLGLASCLGAQFDLTTMSVISRRSKSEIASGLWDAVGEELIIPQDMACSYYRLSSDETDISGIGVGRYAFSHDRIQEAAYLQLSGEERLQTHLQAGRLLLENANGQPSKDELFDIVNHLNFSTALITDSAEIDNLAALNFKAGMSAKKSTAYEAAKEYLAQGIELLNGSGWENHPTTMFQLYLNCIECEFLCGNMQKVDELFRFSIEYIKDRQNKGRLYELMVRISQNDYAYDKGIELGKKGLELFDIQIPTDPAEYEAACATIQAEIARHTNDKAAIQTLADGPKMTDKDAMVCCGLLHELWVCLFMSENPQVLFPAIKLIQLSISKGQSAETAVGYIFYALIQTIHRDYDKAYAFGSLAMTLKDKHMDPLLAPKVLNTFCNFVNHYKHHITTNIPLYEQSHQLCSQSGEIWWGAWAASFIRNARFIKGDPLSKVKATGEKYADYIREAEFTPLVVIMEAQMAKITNLLGETGSRRSIDTPDFNEKETEQTMAAMPFGMGLFWHFVSKTLLWYLYGQQDLALEAARMAEEKKAHDPGLMQFPDHFFFSTLVYTDNWSNFSSEEQDQYGELVARNIQQMNTWQQHCPENYRHRYLLMAAEQDRLNNDTTSALARYDRSIELAQKNGFIHHEAIAYERKALLLQQTDQPQEAKRHLQEARILYLQWGAKRKIKIFDEIHGNLV